MKRALELIMIEEGIDHYKAERSADTMVAKIESKINEAVDKKIDEVIQVIKDTGGMFGWDHTSIESEVISAIEKLKTKAKEHEG